MAYTVFENAALFDGVSPLLATPMHVLVEDNKIKDVSDRPITASAGERIDCRGKTLMPGLIDNHVHVYINTPKHAPPEPPITYRAQYAHKYLRHMLSCGFTSVRDVGGGDHGMAMAISDRYLDGPRFFYGGLCLTQTGGHGDFRLMSQPTDYTSCGAERNVFAVHADGVDECIKVTREELRKGASHIKIMGSGGVLSLTDPLERCQYSEAEIRAIVDECRRRGAYVCAHCYPTEAIRRCVEYGVRSIEHGTLIDAETARYVVENNAYVVPTIAALFALVEDGAQMGVSSASIRKLEMVHQKALSSLDVMKHAGVKMGFGTDLLGDQHTRQGTEFTLRREVLTPFEILNSATAINAEILQMDGHLGVIKPGALADVLVVDGDPLKDIGFLASNGRDLSYIMADGRFVKRPSA
jgi:imidazolonepropionase-like amidohydrolase